MAKMTDPLRFVPGQFWQGKDEEISYVVDVSNWASAPTAACFVIWENTTDRSASNLQSSASAGATISGNDITTPCIVKLRQGVDYRCELRFEQSGEAYEGYFMIRGRT
jgi:hypothetical protein